MDRDRFIHQGECVSCCCGWDYAFFILQCFADNISLFSFPETTTNRLLVRQLEHVLATCNRRYAEHSSSSVSTSSPLATNNNISLQSLNRIASRKILRHCTKNDKMQNWDCVESIEVEALAPQVFGWLGKHGTVGLMYNVIKEMPWLVAKKDDNVS